MSVRAVAISQGDTITLQATPPDGQFVGQGTAEVFCRSSTGSNIGEIPDAQVTITINPSQAGVTSDMFTIQGLGVPVTNVNAATPGNPVRIGPFTGSATFQIVGAPNLLPPGTWTADVAVDIEVVADAWGNSLVDPATSKILHPGTFGDVIAQTPELDSLPLFASGALGLLGYATLRRRARSK